MRLLALVVLVLGVLVAGGAMFYAKDRYAQIEAALRAQAAQNAQQQQEVKPAEPAIKTKPVVIAARELRYGVELAPADVKIVEFPEGSVPANGFASLEELLGAEGGQSKRVVLRAMDPNEPVLKSKVTGFGERATISAQLTPGMRAFTLRIDTVSGVAGFLLPNDRVDIFLTQGGREGLTSNVIMQNVKVIAVDQFSDKDSNRARVARTATVEVSPEQAQKLALAQQVGRISLSLRQIDEVETAEEIPSVDLSDIIKREETITPPAPKKQICTRKGTEVFCTGN